MTAHAISVAHTAAAPTPAALRTFDPDVALARAGGDEAVLRELLGLFLEDCPQLVTAIGRAVDEEDAPALRRAAHTLRGAAATISADMVATIARELETKVGHDDLAGVRAARVALERESSRLFAALDAAREGAPV